MTVNRGTPAEVTTFAGRAFGLELRSDFGVPGLLEPAGLSDRPASSGRFSRVTLADVPALEADWPRRTATRTFALPRSGRGPAMTIDYEPGAGYRVWIVGLGRCLISPDGGEIVYAPPRTGNRWHLLVGQALPIAAALQGLEVLHASAVVLNGCCLAFVAPSGTGKTSLALHLLAHGARFLADDVVALEPGPDGTPLAHPGIGLAHVAAAEHGALWQAGVRVPAPPPGCDKHHVAVRPTEVPHALGAVYFLGRAQDADAVEVAAVGASAAPLLLGATFVAHVPTTSRLVTQLDICSRVARSVPMFTVRAPRHGTAARLAETIARHAAAA